MNTRSVDPPTHRSNVRLAVIIGLLALGFYVLMWLWGTL